MKCPKCEAKLMPVDGEMFCLQCGTLVAARPRVNDPPPALEDTTDPILQKAIVEAVGHPLRFHLPPAAPRPPKTVAFKSMRSVLAPPEAVLAGAGAAMRLPSGQEATAAAPRGREQPAEPERKQPARKRPAVEPGPAQINLLAHAGAARAMTAPKPVVAWPAEGWRWMGGLVVQALGKQWGWVTAVAVVLGFVAINVALYGYYSTRVYPGVRVGGLNLGGVSFEELDSKLEKNLAKPLSVVVGSTKYSVSPSRMGWLAETQSLAARVKAMGREYPLPVAGMIVTAVSRPVVSGYQVNESAAMAVAQELAEQSRRAASNALPVVFGGKAFIIPEKPGTQLNASILKSQMVAAAGRETSITARPESLAPTVAASAYRADVEAAQVRLGLVLQITVRSSVHQPSAEEIGGWLYFGKPGEGVRVNGARVAAYVASLPGSFDRAAATVAMVDTVSAGRELKYAAVTKKITAAPKLPDVSPEFPLQRYAYCLGAGQLDGPVSAVVTNRLGWALENRLAFNRVSEGCNFVIGLMSEADMDRLDPACHGRTTCVAGSSLAIATDSWTTVPKSWSGGLEAYRQELISHVLGQWLGFEHESCTHPPSNAPITAPAAIVIPGCSPNWRSLMDPVTSPGQLAPL